MWRQSQDVDQNDSGDVACRMSVVNCTTCLPLARFFTGFVTLTGELHL